MASLVTFPFLTPTEFESACRALADRARSSQRAETWAPRLVTQNGTSLRITCWKDVQIGPQIDVYDLDHPQENDQPVEDDDPVR
ncbi:hypothetical protein N7468_008678 [Penicillium chermesinum]|uniref:Uncharacterized protein n=1 Tax=Penicillium chermesinum TaxID=63820 RepID=A0A9W9TIJ7_9EURO|nr:uncharacterized protein N7468_008678 [Penicillium chermesinum]KAJ5224136.1 hypothetical protein N7468_008678 [Penicillium chermesinum]KAJ6155050.1 hypothetical protein N7470_005616 [Penicillium chermesinum]